MSNIKIYVSCHKNFYVPENKYIIPIQVGAANTKNRFGFITDDTGDNISEKNGRYCEMTAQYWAWKNEDADYYGFFHYRRYLSFADKKVKKRVPYKDLYYGNMNDDVLKDIELNEEKMKEVIEANDIITVSPSKVKYDYTLPRKDRTVYGHYKHSPQHKIEDLDKTIEIIHELYPDFDKYVQEYLYGDTIHFLNMYVMKKEIFHAYCEWLFPILDKFDEYKDYTNCSTFEVRTPGLIAERMFGIYLTYLKEKNPELKIRECENTFFFNCENPYPKPAFEKHNVPVCFGCDDNYAPFAGVILHSIIKNANPKRNYDILILDNGISENNRYLLYKTVANSENLKLRFLDGKGYLESKKLYEKDHINKSCYLRYALIDILKNYKKAIYLDCDLVVNADLAELYDIDLEGQCLGVVRDTTMASWNRCKGYFGDKQRKYNREVLGLNDLYDYFNSGVLVMDLDQINQVITTEQLFEITEQRDWNWQDQDVLNKVFYKKTKFLDIAWNFMSHSSLSVPESLEFLAPKFIQEAYFKAKNNPKIIHFAGRFMPCYKQDSDCCDIFWAYARESLFYEKILAKMMDEKAHSHPKRESFVRRIGNKLFPKGTRRREIAKKIYYTFKRK